MNSTISIYTDGGSRGNPGEAAYGFAVIDEAQNIIHKEGKRLGIQTNNYAEYMAVISALSWVRDHMGIKPQGISVMLDSQLIARQASGEYRIKTESIRELFARVKHIEDQLEIPVTYTHVPREQNKLADSMVNLALDHKV